MRRNGHRFNGVTGNEPYTKQVYICGDGHQFSWPLRRKIAAPVGLAADYVNDFNSLRALARHSGLGEVSKSTLYAIVREQAENAPTGIELSKKLLRCLKHSKIKYWGRILSLDTTQFKIARKPYHYIQVNDLPSGDSLSYSLAEQKDTTTIVSRLREIQESLHYSPTVVISDLAGEQIYGSPRAFDGVTVQGCLFHLKLWAEKKLLTRSLKKRIKTLESKNRILPRRSRLFMSQQEKAWDTMNMKNAPTKEAKRRHMLRELQDLKIELKRKLIATHLILRVAESRDRDSKQRALSRLDRWARKKNDVVRQTIAEFRKHLEYYHTRKELLQLGVRAKEIKRVRTTNYCECSIGRVKRLWHSHKGFKNVDAFRAYINQMWMIERLDHASRAGVNVKPLLSALNGQDRNALPLLTTAKSALSGHL